MFKRWRRERQLAKLKPGNGSALQPFRWWQLMSRSIFFIELEEADGKHTYAVDARYFQDELSGQENDKSWWDDTGEDDGKSFNEVMNDWLGKDTVDGVKDLLLGNSDRDAGGSSAGAPASDNPTVEEPLSNRGQGSRGVGGSSEAVHAGGGAGDPSSIPSTPNDKKPGKAPAALYRDGVQLYRSKLPATFPVPGGVIEVAASGYGASRMHFVDQRGGEQVLVPHRRAAEGLRARFGKRFPGASRAIGVVAIIILLVGLVVGIPQGIEMITSIEPVAERFGTFTSPIQLPDWANITLLVAGLVAATERALTLRNHWLIDFDTTWTAFG